MTDILQERMEMKQAAKKLRVGQRVVHRTEGVGHIEAIDLGFLCAVDVRWLTPNNEPSVLTSCCFDPRELTPCSDSVVPMPKSDEWWAEAKAFNEAIEAILTEEWSQFPETGE